MVCLLAVSLSSFALAQKIATVNLEEVIRNHPQTEGNKRTLENTQREYEKIRDDLRDKTKEIEEKFLKASELANDAAKKESVREKARNEARDFLAQLRTAEDNLRGKVTELQQLLGRQEQLLFESTMNDVRKNLDEIVKAREIDLVIDKSAERLGAPTTIILYASDKIDLTADLVQLCKASAEKATK